MDTVCGERVYPQFCRSRKKRYGRKYKKRVKQLINEYGNENIYKITLAGKRDPDIAFEVNHLAEEGCVLEILDETIPAYDFESFMQRTRRLFLADISRNLQVVKREVLSIVRFVKAWKRF